MSLKGAAKRRAENLFWLPDEYREMYLAFANRGDMTTAEAKRIMLDHIAVMERRKVGAAA